MADESGWDEGYGSGLLAEFKGLAEAQAADSANITTRAGQLFAIVAGIFTVAQTAALSTFGLSATGAAKPPHAILYLAIAGSVALAATASLSLAASILRKYKAVGELDIEHAADKAVALEEDLSVILAKRYQTQVRNGATVLKTRRVWLGWAFAAAGITVALTVAEIIVALGARV